MENLLSKAVLRKREKTNALTLSGQFITWYQFHQSYFVPEKIIFNPLSSISEHFKTKFTYLEFKHNLIKVSMMSIFESQKI